MDTGQSGISRISCTSSAVHRRRRAPFIIRISPSAFSTNAGQIGPRVFTGVPGPVGDIVSFVLFRMEQPARVLMRHVTSGTAPSSSVQEGSDYLAAGRSRRLQWTFLGGGVFSALQVQVEGRGSRPATITQETDEATG
jgi:hypothetical protein